MSVLTDFLELLDGLLGSAAYFPLSCWVQGFSRSILGSHKSAFQACLGGCLALREKEDPDTSHFQAYRQRCLEPLDRQHWRRGIRYFSGGPAALFWMGHGFVGMTTKFVEVSISHKYRKQDDQGLWSVAPCITWNTG